MANIIDSRGYNLSPDFSGFSQSLGSLINQVMASKLQDRAMSGDRGAMVELASVDPARSRALGYLLQDEQRQAELQRQREEEEQRRTQELIGRFARGYQAANDKAGYLAAGAQQFRQFGMTDIADMIQEDLDVYSQSPGQVDSEYASILSTFGDPSGAALPAAVVEFEHLTKGFTPEQKLQAQMAKTGVAPKAQNTRITMIGGVPYEYDPNTGSIVPAQVGGAQITADTVADNKSKIAESEAEAKEIGKGKGKELAARPAKIRSLRSSIRTLDRSLETADRALGQSGFLSTGVPGQLTSWIAGTPANKLRATLETLKSSLSLDEYKDLKSEGGGLGAATQAEWQMLASSVANLDPNQGDEQLRKSMEIIMRNYKDLKDRTEAELAALEGVEQTPSAQVQSAPRRFKFNPATGKLE